MYSTAVIDFYLLRKSAHLKYSMATSNFRPTNIKKLKKNCIVLIGCLNFLFKMGTAKVEEQKQLLFIEKTKIDRLLEEIKEENRVYTDTIQIQVSAKKR